jgi:chemotaxis protein MotB
MAYSNQPIIIKKVKKHKHAHHGGAWKIAYADFVTAMMAFFLLLWLISMTTPEQKQGLADYFAPTNVSPSYSGAGGVLGGESMEDTGSKSSGSELENKTDVAVPPNSAEEGEKRDGTGGDGGDAASKDDALGESTTDARSKDNLVFHSAAASIRQAWQAMPNITEISDNLLVEETDEGLEIQIIDQQGRPMFPEGSKFPLEMTREAIAAIAPILQQLPNQITISGHTAAGTIYDNPRYGSWELTSDRANVVRTILGEFGLSDDRVHSVIGRSTTEPLFGNDPYMAANARIKILVMYQAPPVPLDLQP